MDDVAIITGASKGIGQATAMELSRRGYRVALTARDAKLLHDVRDAIQTEGGEAHILPGDLSDFAFAESVVTETIGQFGRVDVLVNNAVWREVATMRDISLESWERTLRVGLTIPAYLARWSAESMRSRRRGVIVNVSSMMSRQAAGTSPAYIACKGGLESLTYELASLYGADGIRVVTVSPGAIDTERSRDYIDPSGNDLTSQLQRFSEEMISLGRWGTAEEMAKLIAFVASDDASYLTGTTIMADGGWHRQHFPLALRRQLYGDAPK